MKLFTAGAMCGLMFLGGLLISTEDLACGQHQTDSPRGAIQALRKPPKGDLFALVVGISSYRSGSIPDLSFADKDAEDFADLLRTQRRLYKNIHMKVLVNEAATKRNIEQVLSLGFAMAGKEDSLILFFSGHGAADEQRDYEYFALAHDSDHERVRATGVLFSGMRLISRCKARRALVILDTCHSGSASQLQRESDGMSMDEFVQAFRASSNRIIIAASRSAEASMEDPDITNGVFTHFLLKGLRGAADANGDGIVSVSEAYDYVYGRTRDLTAGIQHPKLDGRLEGVFPLAATAARQ